MAPHALAFPPGAPSRFEALDGCRGVFALMVAVMHLQVGNHLFTSAPLFGGYLAVDFFFVLSGFVIAHVTKLRDARDVGRFAWRRFARVWPLNALMLCLFVGFEAIKFVMQLRGAAHETPAFGPGTQYDPWAVLASLLLVQAFHLFPCSTWNVPSWSISAEFYTYLSFALCALTIRRLWLAALALAALGAAMLCVHAPTMDVTHDFGVPRCLFGFFVGVLMQRVHAARPHGQSGTVRELACVALAFVLMVSWSQTRWSLLAPLVFAPAILVFAREQGAVSRWLKGRPMQALGRWSYAIYMVHAFVFTVSYRVAHLLEGKLGWSLLVDAGPSPQGVPWRVISFGDPWMMDLFTVAILAMVVALAALAHRSIELPAQRWLLRRQPFGGRGRDSLIHVSPVSLELTDSQSALTTSTSA